MKLLLVLADLAELESAFVEITLFNLEKNVILSLLLLAVLVVSILLMLVMILMDVLMEMLVMEEVPAREIISVHLLLSVLL
jgi:hypothetical protein